MSNRDAPDGGDDTARLESKPNTEVVPWKRVLFLSLLSRLLILFIHLVSNNVLEDHNADAYRNPYYLKLLKNSHGTQSDNGLSILEKLPYILVEGLTKWDGQYMLQISMRGYREEQHLAFFPLYPAILAFARYHIWGGMPQEPEDENFNIDTIEIQALRQYILSALIGVILNNFVFFPIAAWSLFNLTLVISSDNFAYAYQSVFWFCINPASVFFSACYTESLFSCLTFTAMYMIEKKSRMNGYNQLTMIGEESSGSDEDRRKNTTLASMHLLKMFWPAIVLISLSGSARSNGLVNMMFVAYQFVVKLLPYYFCKKDSWTIIAYVMVVLELMRASLVFILYAMIGTLGFLSYQFGIYKQFCTQQQMMNLNLLKDLDGMTDLKSLQAPQIPEWCNRTIPIAYSYVQAKYWDVGLFKYYKIKQLPNFLLAAPMIFLVLYGSRNFVHRVRSNRSIDLIKKEFCKKTDASKNAHVQSINNSKFIYYVEAILLTLMCGLVINVQVTTRLLASSCPVIYWICTDIQNESKWKRQLLRTIFLAYFFVGTVLHCNFYPWT